MFADIKLIYENNNIREVGTKPVTRKSTGIVTKELFHQHFHNIFSNSHDNLNLA